MSYLFLEKFKNKYFITIPDTSKGSRDSKSILSGIQMFYTLLSIFSHGEILITTRKQKGGQVVKLYKAGKTTREISQTVHVSFRDIGRIVRKINGEKEPQITSNRSKAYSMFVKSKPIIEVTIRRDLDFDEIRQYYFEYLSLNDLDNFVKICKDHGNILPFINQVAEKMKRFELHDSDVGVLIGYLDDIKAPERC